MKDSSEMYDRAVLIAEANGFKYIDLFLYYQEHSGARFGLKIQPYLNRAVSIQVHSTIGLTDESPAIILTLIDRALLEPIIQSLAFAAMA